MYTVYKITNLTNNKCYIGSSIRVEKRWQEHKNTAFNPNSPHYQYPLYRAFRKYGLKNFSFEIIKNDFNSVDEMRDYEKEMIYFYNSCSYGYNQIYETHPSQMEQKNLLNYIKQKSQKCAKVDINNNILEIYESYHDAARKNGYNEDNASLIRNICKGKIRSNHGAIFKDLDENGKVQEVIYKTQPRRKPIFGFNVLTLEEKYYESISEASRQLGVERARIEKCITGNPRYSIIHNMILRELDQYGNIIEIPNTPTLDEKIQEFNRTNPLINGERHTITEWCKIYNISQNSVYRRIKKGMSVIEAITTPKKR